LYGTGVVEASFPARLALETHDWAGALALKPAANATPNPQKVTYWPYAVAASLRSSRRVARQRIAVTFKTPEMGSRGWIWKSSTPWAGSPGKRAA
jgi:hypothetical protein